MNKETKNQYRCETCNNKDCKNHPAQIECWKIHKNKAKALNILIRQGHIEEMGCASHSSFSYPTKHLNNLIKHFEVMDDHDDLYLCDVIALLKGEKDI